MSIFDRGYAAFKQLVLMDDKIERIRTDVAELKSVARDHENRLIRMETIVQIGLSGGPPTEQARLPGK
jgi:hypothetical protein